MELPTEYQPERFSRRGEFTAWTLTALAFGGWAVILWRGGQASLPYAFLSSFVLLAALAISLTNWMDRHTTLRLDADGVQFENGLRRVSLGWQEIQQVQVYPSRLGKQVRVYGRQTFFNFRTLGEVSLRGEVRGRLGFVEGERILQHILECSGLQRVENHRSNEGWSPDPPEIEYYARK